jgi:hypothetical protein
MVEVLKIPVWLFIISTSVVDVGVALVKESDPLLAKWPASPPASPPTQSKAMITDTQIIQVLFARFLFVFPLIEALPLSQSQYL